MNRNIKIIICILIFIVIFGVILYLKRPKDYIYTYLIDGYEIVEKYYDDIDTYYFNAKTNNNTFEIVIDNKFINKKGLINKVSILSEDNLFCLYMQSIYVNTYPVCINEEKNTFYTSLNIANDEFYKLDENNEIRDSFNNMDIYSLTNKNMAIWNYYGYDFLTKDGKKKILILENESYLDNYSFRVGNYIVLPNYDQNYSFNSIYLIDLNSGNYSLWQLGLDISYDFYVMGIIDKKAYLVDRKEKVEYELDVAYKGIKKISNNGIGKIWNGKWEEESIIKISNNDYSFKDNFNASYKVDNKILSMKPYEGKNDYIVSYRDIDRVIYYNNDGVYYLSKNELFYFTPFDGEIRCIKYNEFEFNKGLSIYIY